MIACDPALDGQSRPEVVFATLARMKGFSLFPVQRWLSPGATAVVGSCPGQRPPTVQQSCGYPQGGHQEGECGPSSGWGTSLRFLLK